jgi:DNA-binding beta-propeller fold protein YncE
VTKRYSIAPCSSPSGLAFDLKKVNLYSVCDNKLMVISNPATGKVVATAPIGNGPDGVAFDDGYAFSANGPDGTITMVGETSPGKFEVVATIPTSRLSKNITADQKNHKLYLSAIESGPPAVGKDGKAGKTPSTVPDSFHILVVGR